MMRYTRVAALLLTALLAACSWKRTPVPLVSETGSAALLVGQWSGEYSSRETGRSGSITFDLASEKDTAFCDVVMIPKIQSVQVTGERGDRAVVRPLPPAEPLKVRFIRLGAGRVSGILDPYIDPDCGCRVTTTFDGQFTAPDLIEGTFVTRSTDPGHNPSGGRWRVTRQTTRVSLQQEER